MLGLVCLADSQSVSLEVVGISVKGYHFEFFSKLMLLFFIKFIRVTLVHKTIQVSKFDISYVISLVCLHNPVIFICVIYLGALRFWVLNSQ